MHVTGLFLKVLLVKNKQHEVVLFFQSLLSPSLERLGRAPSVIERNGDAGKGEHLDF